jgi:hypothetical protein
MEPGRRTRSPIEEICFHKAANAKERLRARQSPVPPQRRIQLLVVDAGRVDWVVAGFFPCTCFFSNVGEEKEGSGRRGRQGWRDRSLIRLL